MVGMAPSAQPTSLPVDAQTPPWSVHSLGCAVGTVIIAAALQTALGSVLSEDESAVFTVAVLVTLCLVGARAGVVAVVLGIVAQSLSLSHPSASFRVDEPHPLVGLAIWTSEALIMCILFGALEASKRRALRSGHEVRRKNRELAESEERLYAAHGELDARVTRRTSELATANESLREEIAARAGVEQTLRESDEVYRVLFKESPNPKIVFDAATLRFVAANDAALRLYGYSTETFLALSLHDIRESRDCAEIVPHVASSNAWSGVVKHRTSGGKIISVQVTSALTKIRGRDVRLACVTDVTERQQLEAQLHHAQKMEAVGRLAGGVAHDFNNMLSIMLGYAALLLEGMPSTDAAYEGLVEIKRAAERSADLTKQLLAFSRQQPRSVEVLDVNDVVRGTEKLVRRLVGEDVEIVTHLEPKGCRAMMDAGQLEQVIMNLVVNARDAMPKGGRLTIETSFVDLDEDYVRTHGGAAPGRYVMLATSDDGLGMDEATQARIFEPFFTTKEQGRGTGLGLAIVFGIVRQSGGLVWVYSEPGHGATFKVYLPATDAAVPEATTETHLMSGYGSETILLVEDEEQVRVLVEKVLHGRGYRVLTAASPSHALEVAAKYPAHIDILLTDVMMPQMNGRDLSDKLLTTRPSTRVLYMSGYTDNVVLDHGVPSALAFLQKPITPNVLSRKLRELLDSAQKAN